MKTDLFKINADYKLTGDQPEAVKKLVRGIKNGNRSQTLLGVTGSGKTFTMANIIAETQKPSLVIAHNKTLAGQLATEFKDYFPDNAVEYFVSYYDYYQPEAYVPQTDLYIEKDASINTEIDRLRHSATKSLFSRKDVIIVASVSCIYGLGSPENYHGFLLDIKQNETHRMDIIIHRLVEMQFERNDYNLEKGKFRIKGDTLEILPTYDDFAIRIEFWGNKIDRISHIDTVTGEVFEKIESVTIYPTKHWLTPEKKTQLAIKDIEIELHNQLNFLKNEGKLLEAERLEQRSSYDLEMLKETGFCSGIENYSCHLGRRHKAYGEKNNVMCGSTPWCLLDYFPKDFLVFIDESHMTIPQLNSMYKGDIVRKKTLVDFGFRLPSAMDNRPLNFSEFEKSVTQMIFVSATPGKYEISTSNNIAEQIIRPTGLLDPTVEIRKSEGQIDDLMKKINNRTLKGERTIVTTLTKRMAEELTEFLTENGIKVHYLHSEQETLERSAILRELRLGTYDVIVGINLLREGLDLPEVSLVAILDADKEGFLRSTSALIQTMGRAARHEKGHVVMYADTKTKSINQAIQETERRRKLQQEYNESHNIIPKGIKKEVRDITNRITQNINKKDSIKTNPIKTKSEAIKIVKILEKEMKHAAKTLDFEKAAMYRDEIIELRKIFINSPEDGILQI